MAWIITTHLAAGTGGAGKFYRARPSADDLDQFQELVQPTGFKMTETRPSVAGYNGRAYYTNAGSDNVMVDEHYRVLFQGLLPPNVVPTLVAGGGTGITASEVVAIAWWDMFTDEWSPLSAVSGTVSLSNQNETVGNIPATPNDPRATHVGIFCSRDGAAFRLATKRQVGVTSVTSAVATLSLTSITGITSGNTFERFPRCAYNTFYHDRQVMAGDARFPDTVYVSEVGFPERYTGLSFRTRNGEPIVALASNRDVCLVFTPFSYYILRGFTDEDMVLTLGDSDIGCIGHHTCQVVNDRIFWCNDKGAWLYNGSPHLIMKDRQVEWQRLYAEFPTEFEDAFSVVDPNESTYSVVISHLTSSANRSGDTVVEAFDIPDLNNTAPETVAFVCDYSTITPELGGSMSQPDWLLDVWNRPTDCAAVLSLPGGRRRDPYYGFCDGYVRYYAADVTSTAYKTDDDDDYNKDMWIRLKAYDFDDPGGDEREGKTLVRLWTYLEAEYSAWTLYCQGGDEKGYSQLLPTNTTTRGLWKNDVEASAVIAQSIDFPTIGTKIATYAPKSVHPHVPEQVSGRCITLQYSIPGPTRVHWRGFGGLYKPGPATRYPTVLDNPS